MPTPRASTEPSRNLSILRCDRFRVVSGIAIEQAIDHRWFTSVVDVVDVNKAVPRTFHGAHYLSGRGSRVGSRHRCLLGSVAFMRSPFSGKLGVAS